MLNMSDTYLEGILVNHKCKNAIILENHRWFELIHKKYGKKCQRIKYDSLDHELLLINDTLISIGQGASIVAALAERFRVSGAKKIVRIATTGSLQENVKIGTVVIPFACIRDEGTSYHYLPKEVPCVASIDLVNSLNILLTKNKISTKIGISWTTDGRWKETTEKINSYKKLQCLSVDMETAGLYSVGMDRNILVASLNIVTDAPHKDNLEYKGSLTTNVWDNTTILFTKIFDIVLEGFENEKI